jgi:predicted nicotinamide N-methyase
VNFQYVDFGIIDYVSGDDIDSNNNNNNNNNNKNNNHNNNKNKNSSINNSQEQQPHLIIEQDRRLGKGGFIWDAGFILAESVLRMEEREKKWLFPTSRQHRVIELGAGTGVTSLIIARSYPSSKVHLTDLPLLQPLLEKNCKSCTNATHGVLEWGKPVNETFDVILAADVVAGIYDSAALAKTICDLSHEKTQIYLAYRERLSGVLDRFESYMNELFTRVERRLPDSTNKSPDVFIICISGKRMYQ